MRYLNFRKKRKELFKLAVIYSLMAVSTITIVTLIIMFLLGFRFNVNDSSLEQYALLQFGSKPSGAIVTVDGEGISSRTPNKTSVPAGKHSITMERDGYKKWSKVVNVKSGELVWLNYALLVPDNLNVEPVSNFTFVAYSLSSADGVSMLVQENANLPEFNIIDLSSDKIKSKKIAIESTLYSDFNKTGVTHSFQPIIWDDGGRYVLVKHVYDNKYEWLVLDTQDVALSKNISSQLNISATKVKFFGTSGTVLYVLDTSGNIRKINLSSSTVSEPLISGVTDFEIHVNSKILTYNGTNIVGNIIAGVYRDGDDKPYDLRNVPSGSGKLLIAAANYFNDDYIAISDGKKVDLLTGNYPDISSGGAAGLKLNSSFEFEKNIDNLSFSPTGEYVFVQSGAYFASYDIEYGNYKSSLIQGDGDTRPLVWLNSVYIWSDRDGNLTIREFDGENIHLINKVAQGQGAALTHNGRYIYSIGASNGAYQLQRVRMTLP